MQFHSKTKLKYYLDVISFTHLRWVIPERQRLPVIAMLGEYKQSSELRSNVPHEPLKKYNYVIKRQ